MGKLKKPKYASLLPGYDEKQRHAGYGSIEETRDITPHADKKRKRSLNILYLICFRDSVIFSLYMSSIWLYLTVIDSDADTIFFGWIIMASNLGAVLSNPLVGMWASRHGSCVLPIITMQIVLNGSAVLYAYLEDFQHNGKWWMMLSRLLMGIGTGTRGAIRSSIAACTTLEERGQAFASVTMAQISGFAVGTACEAALVLLGYPGPISSPYFRLDMFTAPAWFSAITGLLPICLLWFMYTEQPVDDFAKEVSSQEEQAGTSSSVLAQELMTEDCSNTAEVNRLHARLLQPDYLAAWLCVAFYFILFTAFSLIEITFTPMCMHELNWDEKEVTFYLGLMYMSGSLFAIACFIATRYFIKQYDARRILIMSLLATAAGLAIYLPLGSTPPTLQLSTSNITSESGGVLESGGCPPEYDWCHNPGRLQLWQLIVGSVIFTIGYPASAIIVLTLYSKILGPRPQGLMMGIIISTGSLARMLGSIYIANIYENYGPKWTILMVVSAIILIIVCTLALYHRLVTFYDYNKHLLATGRRDSNSWSNFNKKGLKSLDLD